MTGSAMRSFVSADAIPAVCLMGTTATGKTDAAASLADAIDGEIISVDSSLVYKDMNIGTAKPDGAFLARYPHYLVDVREPNDTYSVADFYDDASEIIRQVTNRGRIPILVGGTHFYFHALEHGMNALPKADSELRQQISTEAEQTGWPTMHGRLEVLDPVSAKRIDPHDAQRIQRALEIVIAGGRPVADYDNHRKPPLANPMIKIALAFSDRGQLHERIALRFDAMLAAGLEQEVRDLLNEGVDPQATSMKMIGYRQMLSYISGQIDEQSMREQGIVATRRLAKRQLTWLRNQSNLIWWTDWGLKQKKFDQLIDFVDIYIK